MDTPRSNRRGLLIAGVMSAILVLAVTIAAVFGKNGGKSSRFQVVASFYPIYVAALNITDGVNGVDVVNLTPEMTGCLHDYQLTPDNMMTLQDADLLLINGGGAESFLDKVRTRFPSLAVVDSSHDIALLESGHTHDHGEDAHGHEDEEAHDHDEDEDDSHDEAAAYNEHIWTSPARYKQQIENLRDGLIAADSAHAEVYRANADAYIAKIDAIYTTLKTTVQTLPTTAVVTFHDSITYFAEDLGLDPVAALSIGEDEGVSATDLTEATKKVTAAKQVLLLYDKQYPVEYAYIASGAQSRTLILNMAVTPEAGGKDQDAWLKAMQHNLELLRG